MPFNGWLIKRDPKIRQLGYVEADSKRGLFYKRCSAGVAFLDHRINDDYPYRDQYEAGPRYYFKILEPKWQSVRNQNYEEGLLLEHDIQFMPPLVPDFETYSDITGEPEDGFCQFCNKDFQDKGAFCSPECERNYKNQPHDLCEACQGPVNSKEGIRHHTSYFPEETVIVHQSCHVEIHRSDKYIHLRPPDDDKDRFYKKGKYKEIIQPSCKIHDQDFDEFFKKFV
jgi:hypothetical protein